MIRICLLERIINYFLLGLSSGRRLRRVWIQEVSYSEWEFCSFVQISGASGTLWAVRGLDTSWQKPFEEKVSWLAAGTKQEMGHRKHQSSQSQTLLPVCFEHESHVFMKMFLSEIVRFIVAVQWLYSSTSKHFDYGSRFVARPSISVKLHVCTMGRQQPIVFLNE